jgi:hypothetical protein
MFGAILENLELGPAAGKKSAVRGEFTTSFSSLASFLASPHLSHCEPWLPIPLEEEKRKRAKKMLI